MLRSRLNEESHGRAWPAYWPAPPIGGGATCRNTSLLGEPDPVERAAPSGGKGKEEQRCPAWPHGCALPVCEKEGIRLLWRLAPVSSAGMPAAGSDPKITKSVRAPALELSCLCNCGNLENLKFRLSDHESCRGVADASPRARCPRKGDGVARACTRCDRLNATRRQAPAGTT